MRKITILLTINILLNFTSCIMVDSTDENINDKLTISTYLVAKEYEDIGYLNYDPSPKKVYGDIQWTLFETGEVIPADKSYVYEQLKLNEPRLTAPMGYGGYNLLLNIEFDGIIQIEHHQKGDDMLYMSYKVDENNWSTENPITHIGPVSVSICPIGKFTKLTSIISSCTLTDKEYYIDIKTFKLDGTPVITAQLKLTVADDEYYPSDEITISRLYTVNDKKSRLLEIELVKYSYSDTALHDEFERYDHLYN